MPLNKYELPWDSQPQDAVEVNPDLQTGLLAAFNGAQISRLANGFPATLVGSIGSGVTPRGLGYQGDGTGKYAYYDNPSISTSALTILAVVYDGTTGTADRRALSVADRANANNYLAIGRGSTAAAKARVLAVVDGSAGTSTVETTRNVFDGQVHAIALRWTRGVGTQSFVDGSIDAFAVNTTAANINATGTTVCALGRSTFATFYSGAVLLGASWARGLSDQECAELTANPWSLFAPRSIWVPSTALKVPTRRRLIEQVTPWESQPQESVGIADSVTATVFNLLPGAYGSRGQSVTLGAGGTQGPNYIQGAAGLAATLGGNTDTWHAPRTGDFTLVAVFRVTTPPGSGVNHVIASNTDAVTATNHWEIFSRGDGTGYAIRGFGTVSTLFSAKAESVVTLVVQRIGTQLVFQWRDQFGNGDRQVATDATDYYNRKSAPVGLFRSRDGGTAAGTGQFLLFAFDLASRTSVSELIANPWQLFTPRTTYIPGYNPYVTIRRTRKMEMPWSEQPQEAVGVDWGNPLSQGLKSAVLILPGAAYDSVTGAIAAPSGFAGTPTSGFVLDVGGWNVAFDGTNDYLSFGSYRGGTNATGLTIACRLKLASVSINQRIVVIRVGGVSFQIAGYSSSQIGAFTAGAALGGASPAVGTWVTVFAEFAPTTNAAVGVYIDKGSLLSTSLGAGGDTTTAQYTIGSQDGANRFSSATVNRVFVFDRVLSASDRAQIVDDPWQLFAPRQEWILSSSEVLMPTLSLPTLTGIGSTTARPRVSITY